MFLWQVELCLLSKFDNSLFSSGHVHTGIYYIYVFVSSLKQTPLQLKITKLSSFSLLIFILISVEKNLQKILIFEYSTYCSFIFRNKTYIPKSTVKLVLSCFDIPITSFNWNMKLCCVDHRASILYLRVVLLLSKGTFFFGYQMSHCLNPITSKNP